MSTHSVHLATSSLPIPSLDEALTPARPTYLMCPPHLYDVNYVINPWMAGNLHNSSRARAAEQWQQLHEAISRVADTVLIDPVPGLPDMVFTANAGLERNGIVALSSFFHPERQGEEEPFRRWFLNAGYTVIDVPRSTPFEGEGDALFARDGSRLWAGFGPRTATSSHHALREAWHIGVTPLRLVDPRFYHLDTCFAPLEDDFVMYYPAAFDQASVAKIESFYSEDKRIILGEADAVQFAANAINEGGTIILNEISRGLADRLSALGFEVVQVQLSEFLKAGGAAKCLVMKLSKLVPKMQN